MAVASLTPESYARLGDADRAAHLNLGGIVGPFSYVEDEPAAGWETVPFAELHERGAAYVKAAGLTVCEHLDYLLVVWPLRELARPGERTPRRARVVVYGWGRDVNTRPPS